MKNILDMREKIDGSGKLGGKGEGGELAKGKESEHFLTLIGETDPVGEYEPAFLFTMYYKTDGKWKKKKGIKEGSFTRRPQTTPKKEPLRRYRICEEIRSESQNIRPRFFPKKEGNE